MNPLDKSLVVNLLHNLTSRVCAGLVRTLLAAAWTIFGLPTVAGAVTLAVNGTSAPTQVTVSPGATVTVTVTGGPGSTTDWVALYVVGAGNGSYTGWKYLNGSTTPPSTALTDAVLTFVMPQVPGLYEFRFLVHNSFTSVATSGQVRTTFPAATITVGAGVTSPVPPGRHVSVTVSGGPGALNDWVGLFRVGATSGNQYIVLRQMNGATTQTFDFPMPVETGSYEFRLYWNGSYTEKVGTSPQVRVALVSYLTVAITSPQTHGVTLGVHRGPGEASNWVGLFQIGASDVSPITYQNVAAGVFDASLAFSVPADGAQYEFRFFNVLGYPRVLLAKSGSVSCAASCTGPAEAVQEPILTIMPFENPDDPLAPVPFLEGCLNMGQWPAVAARTAFYGDTDWAVEMVSNNADQATCFANLNNAGIKLALEVPVLKDWCHTGDECFDSFYTKWERMRDNGAQLGVVYLDEPLTAVRKGLLQGDFNYAVAQTKRFIERLRAVPELANVLVVSIEAYPYNWGLVDWIAAIGSGPNRADYFEVDHNPSEGALDPEGDFWTMSWQSHNYGMGFAILYSWAGQGSDDYSDWYVAQATECYYYSGLPGTWNMPGAEMYHVSAFNHAPRVTAPENQPYSLMYTTKYLVNDGCFK